MKLNKKINFAEYTKTKEYKSNQMKRGWVLRRERNKNGDKPEVV